jgi:N-acetylglucosamine-6-sulfatase
MRRAVQLLASIATAMLLASAVLVVLIDTTGSEAAAAERPNIVFVLTDDQFPGSENSMPNLKSNVTSKGLKFTNMTSTFPLCCPGRATIQRGQYAHNTKIYGNSSPLGGWNKFKRRGEHRSTMATWLNRSGYQTGLFGKYMNNYRARTIPPGWDRWYGWNGPKMGWSSVNDQGNQKPLVKREADGLVSKKALEFLGNRLDNSAPVFAFVSFGAMHEPYYYAERDDDRFRGAGVPRTPSFNEVSVADKPAYLRNPRLSRSEISDLDQSYRKGLRSLMRVDRFIGNASDLLRRKGEMDDTYFVFYTDNGAHFGQHRLPHGKLQPYEEDVNFPLIVRGPGIPRGAKSGKLVGNHDVAPTFARMGGASFPAFVDGRSFLGLAKDPSAPWPRTAILSERENNSEAPNKWSMLRMGGGKVYTRHEGGAKEYYALAKDPHQVHNALGAGDTTYLPPDRAILAYYEQRLNALYACAGQSCRTAEDAPLKPTSTAP